MLTDKICMGHSDISMGLNKVWNVNTTTLPFCLPQARPLSRSNRRRWDQLAHVAGGSCSLSRTYSSHPISSQLTGARFTHYQITHIMSGRKQLKLLGIFNSRITNRGYVLLSQVGKTVLPAMVQTAGGNCPRRFPVPWHLLW